MKKGVVDMKEKVRNYRTERFKWYDFIFFLFIFAFLIILIGQEAGFILVDSVIGLLRIERNNDLVIFLSVNFAFIGIWIVVLLIFLIPSNRPMFRALGKRCKGNNIKLFLLGILIGFGTNALCILCAVLHRDIYLYFSEANIPVLVLLLVAVFIQATGEELVMRVYLYQRLRRAYKSPAVAIVGNALIFALLHLLNPGINPMAVASIIVAAVSFSLYVYYCDSIWLPMGVHMAWNYTQNILFGLPNSGYVSKFSLFKLDAATATNSFAYNVEFGVEATLMAVIVLVLCCFLTIYWGKKNNKKPTDIWST